VFFSGKNLAFVTCVKLFACAIIRLFLGTSSQGSKSGEKVDQNRERAGIFHFGLRDVLLVCQYVAENSSRRFCYVLLG